ncbi:MAG: iron ABC transporter permease [Pseudomonadota bacterium]|nr:iron ABC transporter permease [Pseudomonadota bacterium]
MKHISLIIILLLLSIFSVIFSLGLGSISSDPSAIWVALTSNNDSILRDIVINLRWPRIMAAFATGAALAIAGVMMQVLLRNPLADPYILGTSGGASVGALTAMLMGLSGFAVDGIAFIGAFISTILVFSLSNIGGERSPGRLLLTGVVMAAGWGAMVSLILSLAEDNNLRGMLFWLMGDFSFSSSYLPLFILSLITLIIGIILAPTLNLLSTGEQQASLLGANVKPVRNLLFFLSSLLTAFAVTTAGTVGFVGLIVPHLIRIASNADHRTVIPCSALAGGCLLVISDSIARTIIAPQQLPVGAITAIIGVPLFLFLLQRISSQNIN